MSRLRRLLAHERAVANGPFQAIIPDLEPEFGMSTHSNEPFIGEAWPRRPLRIAAPEFCDGLLHALQTAGRHELVDQLDRTCIPAQRLAGTRSSFSFMALPWPLLDAKERRKMDFRGEEELELMSCGGKVRLALDGFGQINWFYVDQVPAAYDALMAADTKGEAA